MEMHCNFTVPLTARVLRAILSDMEGTDALLAAGQCCAGRQCGPVPTPVTMTKEELAQELEAGVEGEMSLQDFNAINAPMTSGIVEQGNPFAAAEPSSGLPPVPMPPVPMPPVVPTPENMLAAAAMVVNAPMPPTPPTGVPVDSEGLPWDKRIHASTRTRRIGDDTWKLMKGVDKDLVERVKAELRATMSAGTVPVAPVVTPQPPVAAHLSGSYSAATGHVVGIPTPHNYSGAQSGGYTPQPPPAPVTVISQQDVTEQSIPLVPVAPTPPTPPATGPTFSDFVTYATNKIVAKEFSKLQLQEACAAEGITSMPMLENRPDLIPAIWKFLDSICLPASSVGGA